MNSIPEKINSINESDNEDENENVSFHYQDSTHVTQSGGPGVFSTVFITWLTPILRIGYKRPLKDEDMPFLSKYYSSVKLSQSLELNWAKQVEKIDQSCMNKWVPELFYAIMASFGRPFIFAGFLKFFGDICALANPMILRLLLKELAIDSREPMKSYVFIYTTLLFLFTFLNSILVNSYFGLTMRTGVKARTSVTSMVFAKSLRLSARSRQLFPTGTLQNILITDAGRVESAAGYIHYIWSGVFLSISMLIALFWLLRWAALCGTLVLIMVIPAQSLLIKRMSLARKASSKATDLRIKIMEEIVQGIRVIKMYSWERCFWSKLSDSRRKELRSIRQSLLSRSLISTLSIFGTVFSCISSFLFYRLVLGKPLTLEVVFPSLAYFVMLNLPLILLPMVINMAVDGRISLQRIQSVLLAEELDWDPVVDRSGGIFIENADFEYESESRLTEPANEESKFLNRIEAAAPKKKIDESSSGSVSKSETLRETKVHSNFALRDVNLKIEKGHLVAVVGSVGSGKSSLLSAIVGELKRLDKETSRIITQGSIAYCPQQAWIQNSTVEANILFGSSMNRMRYENVLGSCALLPDLKMLPDGDQTQIGEKGVNISGGQRQRLSLARAAYSKVGTVLLDDPLSAVDAHVGKLLFENCICGIMRGRTRILVTNQLHILPQVDSIIVMDRGRIVERGTFAELKDVPGGVLRRLLGSLVLKSKENDESFQPLNNIAPIDFNAEVAKSSSLSSGSEVKKTDSPKNVTAAEERVFGAIKASVYAEYIRSAGGLLFVISALGFVVLTNFTRILTDSWIRAWTAGDRTLFYGIINLPVESENLVLYGGIYIFLGFAQVLLSLSVTLSFVFGCSKASRMLHKRAAWRVLHAPVPTFFDTNPTGRILARFTRDTDVLDSQFYEALRMFFQALGSIIFTFGTMIIFLNWWMSFVVVVLGLIYWYIQKYYRASCREVKRLDSLARSPISSHLNETLSGVVTIRAYKRQQSFLKRLYIMLDSQNRVILVQMALQRWLAIRLELLGATVVLAVSLASAILIFTISPDVVNRKEMMIETASIAGLLIMYSLNVTGTMSWCVRQASDVEQHAVSSERLHYYANVVPREEASTIEALPDQEELNDLSVPSEWPSEGNIVITGMSLRYRPDLEPVVKNLHVSIRAGERVGVVGRTGAGKSSIMLSLFRIVEPEAYVDISENIKSKVSSSVQAKSMELNSKDCLISTGNEGNSIIDLYIGGNEATVEKCNPVIAIDGLDIQKIRLETLRSRLSIIPQDPVIFSDTVRWNLDPFGRFTDDQLWDVLEKTHLKDAIRSLALSVNEINSIGHHESRDISSSTNVSYSCSVNDESVRCFEGGLEVVLSEGGQNLSLGQRQLLCLARAMLRQSKILVLDEATANIDPETDRLIQETIRKHFSKDCTLLTIAHRINTVIDYDRILVLDRGTVAEFDSPAVLLANPNSLFSALHRQSLST